MYGTGITIIEQCVPKRRHKKKIRRRGINQRKEYNIHNTAKSLKSRPILIAIQSRTCRGSQLLHGAHGTVYRRDK
jgi:hypothetical protein